MDADSTSKLRIHSILPKHVEMMERLILGHTQTEIAHDMGMSISRVNIIINSPLFQLEMKRRLLRKEERLIDIQDNLLRSVMAGSKLQREILEDDKSPYPIGLKLKIANDVASQMARIVQQSSGPITNEIEDDGDGSYEERLKKVTYEESIKTHKKIEGESRGIDPEIREVLNENYPPSELTTEDDVDG